MNLANHPELLDKLASAYALGSLRGGARRRFESLARQNPVVRSAAILWQERFAALTELQPVQAPDPNVWKRIQNIIDAEPAPIVQTPAPAQERRWQRPWLWRGAAFAGGLATLAAVAVGLNLGRELDRREAQLASAGEQAQQLSRQNAELTAQLESRPEIRYVAVLHDDAAAAKVLVTFDPRQNTLTLKRLGDFREGPDKSLELWALPGGAAQGGPRSLGVLDGGTVVRLTAAEGQVQQAPALAITLEPKGGVPPGSGPTGPILFKGALLQTPV